MYFEIIMESDLSKIEADALVLPSDYYHSHKGELRNDQHVIALKNNKWKFECSFIANEIRDKKYKTIGIPISMKEPRRGFYRDVTISALKDDVFLDLITNPSFKHMIQIILITDDAELTEDLKKDITKKKSWPASWKLSFVINALNSDLEKEFFKTHHFIDETAYPKYLKKFSDDCVQDLTFRVRGLLNLKYQKMGLLFYDLLPNLLRLYSIIKDDNNALKNIQNIVEDEFFGIWPLESRNYSRTEILDTLITFHPLYIYIRDLIPYDELQISKKHLYWDENKIVPLRLRKKSAVKGKSIEEEKKGTKFKKIFVDSEKKQIKEGYHLILKSIQKLKELKNNTIIFPIDLLKSFWGNQAWDDIISDEVNSNEAATNFFADFFDCSTNAVADLIYRK